MALPSQVQELCLKYLEKVRNDRQHQLTLEERFNIYRSFGPSRLDLPGYNKQGELFNYQEYTQLMREEFQNFGLADYTLGWLAILTARKVLPVCELIWKQVQKERPVLTPDGFNLLLKNILDKEIEFSEETRKSYQGNQFWNNEPEVRPQELLQVGESLLQHKLTFEEAEKQYEILSYEYEGLSRRVTYEVDYALGAVDAAVDFIINGVKGRNFTQAGIREDTDFFVIAALEAFTALDKNPPGAHSGEIPEYVMDEFILTKRSPTIEEINQLLSEPLIPIEYDLEKRLQFWEWWLTEAIPQAWELAQEQVEK